MTLQEQLIYYRKKQGLSQEQLGNQIGVSRQTVSKWELGLTTPEMDKLIQMSRLFDVSIDELVGNQRGSEATGREKSRMLWKSIFISGTMSIKVKRLFSEFRWYISI